MSKEMPNGVSKDTIKTMNDTSAQLHMLIDYIATTNQKIDSLSDKIEDIENKRYNEKDQREISCDQRWDDCDRRFKRLERWGYGIMGVVFLASVVSPIVVAWVG